MWHRKFVCGSKVYVEERLLVQIYCNLSVFIQDAISVIEVSIFATELFHLFPTAESNLHTFYLRDINP